MTSNSLRFQFWILYWQERVPTKHTCFIKQTREKRLQTDSHTTEIGTRRNLIEIRNQLIVEIIICHNCLQTVALSHDCVESLYSSQLGYEIPGFLIEICIIGKTYLIFPAATPLIVDIHQ